MITPTVSSTNNPYWLKIVIPGLPKRMNESLRGGWQVKYVESKKWKTLIGLIVRNHKPSVPLAKATVTCVRVSSSEPDYDGLVSTFKHPIDGLVDAGIIAGDKMSNIGKPDFQWKKGSPGKGHIIIEVRES